jgi:hypothetical protein
MNIVTQDLTDPKARAYEDRLDEIGRVIRMPFGVDKLRAIAGLWMSDPDNGAENRQQMAACAMYCKELRDTRRNKFGTSGDKNSAIRNVFSPPAGLMQVIEVFETSAWGGAEGRRNWQVFKQAFPQFKTSKKGF